MAIAGRVAIVPKDAYDSTVAYQKLDLVRYNHNVYIAKKSSTGILPTDEEYWMLAIENVTQEQYEAIVNGTTAVGNASQLGGKGASEYALASQLFSKVKDYANLNFDTALTTSIFTSTTPPNNVGATNYPVNATGILVVFSNGGRSVTQQYFTYTGELWRRSYFTGIGWTKWDRDTTTADLANYLPLSGGTLGNGDSYQPLGINGRADGTYLEFFGNGTRYGRLGYYGGAGRFVLLDNQNQPYDLLHTGNKPTGTYTGNGSSTERVIYTGGIGEFAVINSTNGFALLSRWGALYVTESGVTYNRHSYVNATSIVLYTDHSVVNANGVTYTYFRL